MADKDKHLTQLRERLTELEGILDNSGSLMQNFNLGQRNREMEREIAAVSRKSFGCIRNIYVADAKLIRN